MALIKVHKNSGYTIMSNHHLNDRRLSLKAKGLLSLMFSLPDDWDYSVKGLVAICKEKTAAVETTLRELKDFGYLVVIKKFPNETQSGRIEYIYDIYEYPMDSTQKQEGEKQPLEFQEVENPPVNKILNNKVLKNMNEGKKERITSEELIKENIKAGACVCACEEENKNALEEYTEACEMISEECSLIQDKVLQAGFVVTLKNLGKDIAKSKYINICGNDIASSEVLDTLRKAIESGANDKLFVRTIKEVQQMTLDGKIKGNQEGYLISTLYNRVKLGGFI